VVRGENPVRLTLGESTHNALIWFSRVGASLFSRWTNAEANPSGSNRPMSQNNTRKAGEVTRLEARCGTSILQNYCP
jgi:hypothetical protein